MGKFKTFGKHAALILNLMTGFYAMPVAADGLIDLRQFVFEQVSRELRGAKAATAAQAAAMTNAIVAESRRNGLDPLVVLSVIATESRFRVAVVGQAGEIGLMQIKPDTAEWIAGQVGLPWKGKASLKDPATNIGLGAAYLAYLSGQFQARRQLYLTAYNMGAGRLRQLLSQARKPRIYASKVLKNYAAFESRLAARQMASR